MVRGRQTLASATKSSAEAVVGTKKTERRNLSFITSSWTVVATVIRLLLIFNFGISKDISMWMSSANLRSVLIDPVYTLTHVNEANAIRHLGPIQAPIQTSKERFVDAYRGHKSGHSRIHLPPLVLIAAESFQSLWMQTTSHRNARSNEVDWQQQVVLGLLLLLVDLWIGRTLERLSRNVLDREDPNELDWMAHMNPKIAPTMAHIFPLSAPPERVESAATVVPPLFPWHEIPLCVALLYYGNPITILAGSGPTASFQNIRLACLVTALCEASSSPYLTKNGNRQRPPDSSSATTSALALAVATYLDLHCLVFLIPMAIWHGAGKAKTVGTLWDFFSVSLLSLSALLVGDDLLSIVATTHLYPYTLTRHSPSLSTLWYFGMQMFGRFRSYFEFLLGGFPYLLVAPVTIRLHRYPAVLVAMFWFMGVLFRPPGTLYNLNVGLCFFLMNPRTMARMNQLSSLFVLFAIPIPVVLYLVGYWMWLEPSNGEANYVFFQCLAYNIFVAILFLNFCSAALRRDKALRLTIKASRGGAVTS